MKFMGFEHKSRIYTEQLNFLEPILNEWVRVNRDIREQTGTNLNWFNERANLSALAGAVWRCGGVAVEEYSSPKGEEGSMGRIDLFFKFNNKAVICESKHRWLFLPSYLDGKDFIGEIERDLELENCNAKDDISHTLQSRKNKCDFGLAITYYVPYWKGSESRHQALGLKKQIEELKCDFYAYLECTGFDPLVNSKGEGYSSILMVGHVHKE
tara:strand:+ start:4999 stop:5634 length:636 start_codon:yes stop_codon:yes gene_type:complete